MEACPGSAAEAAQKCKRASADSSRMVDLQRPICGIWNIVGARKQDGPENSNAPSKLACGTDPDWRGILFAPI